MRIRSAHDSAALPPDCPSAIGPETIDDPRGENSQVTEALASQHLVERRERYYPRSLFLASIAVLVIILPAAIPGLRSAFQVDLGQVSKGQSM